MQRARPRDRGPCRSAARRRRAPTHRAAAASRRGGRAAPGCPDRRRRDRSRTARSCASSLRCDGIGDDEQRARALAARELRLRVQRGLRHRARAVEAAVRFVLLRLVSEDQDGLARRHRCPRSRRSRARGREPVAGEHERQAIRASPKASGVVARGGERVVARAERETRSSGRAYSNRQACCPCPTVRPALSSNGWNQRARAARLQPGGLELLARCSRRLARAPRCRCRDPSDRRTTRNLMCSSSASGSISGVAADEPVTQTRTSPRPCASAFRMMIDR